MYSLNFAAVGALSVQWNMGSPEELALSLSNGTLLLLSVAQDVTIACKKENMNANIGESDDLPVLSHDPVCMHVCSRGGGVEHQVMRAKGVQPRGVCMSVRI